MAPQFGYQQDGRDQIKEEVKDVQRFGESPFF
jgi:hypothetical protein